MTKSSLSALKRRRHQENLKRKIQVTTKHLLEHVENLSRFDGYDEDIKEIKQKLVQNTI